MTLEHYIEKVSTRLRSGISREHSYRGDLETLIRELVQGVEITNEPANVLLTIKKIAEIKEMNKEEVADQIFMNYQRLFL